MDQLWIHLERIADVAIVIVPLALWLGRWVRRIGIDSTFTRSVAKIHLPHIYRRLHSVDGGEHPDIVYLNGDQPAAQKQ